MESNKAMGRGRPTVTFNDEQISELEILGQFFSIEDLANYFKLSYNTICAIFKREPELLLRFNQGRANAIKTIAGEVYKQAQKGNLKACQFYLRNKAGWNDKHCLNSIDKPQLTKDPNKNILKIIDSCNKNQLSFDEVREYLEINKSHFEYAAAITTIEAQQKLKELQAQRQ